MKKLSVEFTIKKEMLGETNNLTEYLDYQKVNMARRMREEIVKNNEYEFEERNNIYEKTFLMTTCAISPTKLRDMMYILQNIKGSTCLKNVRHNIESILEILKQNK